MLEKRRWMASRRPNSMAIISAQPMLRPFLSQLGKNFQESHSLSKTTPTPQEDEASTQNSIEEAVGGLERDEPQKVEESWVRHQMMSDITLELGVFRAKGEW